MLRGQEVEGIWRRDFGLEGGLLEPLVTPHMHVLTSAVLGTRPRNVFMLLPVFKFNILETSFYYNINLTFFWWSSVRSCVATAGLVRGGDAGVASGSPSVGSDHCFLVVWLWMRFPVRVSFLPG